jgi:hypothetical protein
MHIAMFCQLRSYFPAQGFARKAIMSKDFMLVPLVQLAGQILFLQGDHPPFRRLKSDRPRRQP